MQVTKTGKPKEFTIPLDLLKSFQTDIRWIPLQHNNGYIRFDIGMLQKILLSDNVKERQALVEHLKELTNRGGMLAIVGPSEDLPEPIP